MTGAAGAHLKDQIDKQARAMQVLLGHPAVVKLLAVGQLKMPDNAAAAAPAAPVAAAAAAAQAVQQCTASAADAFSAPGEGASCLVMELLPQSLEGRMQQLGGALSEAEVQQYMRGLLTVLDDMHSGRCGPFVAHRDVKPANVLLRADGSLAMADLGLHVSVQPGPQHRCQRCTSCWVRQLI
jgi:serine/threonine protein kinase